jgi:hypothetical protein
LQLANEGILTALSIGSDLSDCTKKDGHRHDKAADAIYVFSSEIYPRGGFRGPVGCCALAKDVPKKAIVPVTAVAPDRMLVSTSIIPG